MLTLMVFGVAIMSNTITNILNQVATTTITIGHVHGHFISEAQLNTIRQELARSLTPDSEPPAYFSSPLDLELQSKLSARASLLARLRTAPTSQIRGIEISLATLNAEISRIQRARNS
jgi:hypothetical protein